VACGEGAMTAARIQRPGRGKGSRDPVSGWGI
jgi:hypothetical protein